MKNKRKEDKALAQTDTKNIGRKKQKEERRMIWSSIKRNKACYAMLAPFMIFFIVFTVIPVVMSLPIGFTDFNMAQSPKYIGLSNYTTLFLSDKIFIKSIRVTIVFALFTGPVSYILCFLLAWLINELHPKLKTVFTLIFYAPSMANIYTVWQLIFSGDMNGYINSFLINLGLINAPIQWLTDAKYVLGATIVVSSGSLSEQASLPFVRDFRISTAQCMRQELSRVSEQGGRSLSISLSRLWDLSSCSQQLCR